MSATQISVSCRPAAAGWDCSVELRDEEGAATYDVSVSRPELDRYAPGSGEPGALVTAAFRFLLERESRQSILRRFGLGEIERYFPEFDTAIPSYL